MRKGTFEWTKANFWLKNFWDCGRKKIELLFVNRVEKKMEKDYGWSRGEGSEEKVCQALEELKAEGMIKNFGQSLKFYQEDLKKRDFIIITNDEKTIWLQVKSSFHQADKEKCLKKGIRYIAVQQKSHLEVKKEILEILEKARNQKRRPKLEERIKAQI